MKFRKYSHFGSIVRLRNEGRELIDREIYWTVKRDGQNIPVWIDDENNVRVSSRNLENADEHITSKVQAIPDFSKVVEILREEPQLILYFEHMQPGRGPTKIEMPRKTHALILIDGYDTKAERYLSYNRLHQIAYQNKLKMVECLEITKPMSIQELYDTRDRFLEWCIKHKKEGVVGKHYHGEDQIFFKEKIDLPKLKVPKKKKGGPTYPPMPTEKVNTALERAKEECDRNDEDFKDPKFAMPRVANHISAEAREHNYASPKSLFPLYKRYLEELSNAG